MAGISCLCCLCVFFVAKELKNVFIFIPFWVSSRNVSFIRATLEIAGLVSGQF
jgi:hypothetical protein